MALQAPARIIVVDDDASVLEALEVILTGAGHTVRGLSKPAPTPRQPNPAIRGGDPRFPPAPPALASRDKTPDPAEKLYQLGLLQADPTSGLRDYRAARATFTRLLSEYPRSRWE